MVQVRRRYATQMVFPPLFPALKGRAIFRDRNAAKNVCGIRRDAGVPSPSFTLQQKVFSFALNEAEPRSGDLIIARPFKAGFQVCPF
jgi:hypothetical protein